MSPILLSTPEATDVSQRARAGVTEGLDASEIQKISRRGRSREKYRVHGGEESKMERLIKDQLRTLLPREQLSPLLIQSAGLQDADAH